MATVILVTHHLQTQWLQTIMTYSHSGVYELGSVYLFARAAITNKHRLNGLNRNLCSQGSGGWKSKIDVSAALVSPAVSLLGLLVATFLLCLHMVFPLCVHTGVS